MTRIRRRQFRLALLGSVAYACLGVGLWIWFSRTGSVPVSRAAGFVLWPARLVDFWIPWVFPVPALWTLFLGALLVGYQLVVLAPWWLGRTTSGLTRKVLGFAALAAHVALSAAMAKKTGLLFELGRVVRDL